MGGHDQGILVVPQPSLVSELSAGAYDLSYSGQVDEKEALKLYQVLTDALVSYASELSGATGDSTGAGYAGNPFAAKAKMPKIVASAWFGGNQNLEFQSSGPFMHSFNF